MGYSFHGTYCEHKNFHLIGVYIIVLIFLFYVSIKIAEILLRRKLAKSVSSEYTPLLQMDSGALQKYLISTNISLQDVELVVGSAKLLSNVNLAMRSGELTAVIGPSGAGKSTIMKVKYILIMIFILY